MCFLFMVKHCRAGRFSGEKGPQKKTYILIVVSVAQWNDSWKSLAHGPEYQMENHLKILKSLRNSAHKRLFSKKSGTISKNVLVKNFARVLFAGEGVWKSVAHGPKYQIENHQKCVQNSAHKRFFLPNIWNNIQKYAGKFSQKHFVCRWGCLKIISTWTKISNWKSPKMCTKFSS